jgi:hypothetical protein
MATTLPADHIARLRAATDDRLAATRDHNKARADQDWAAGNRTEARRWYAYADTAQAILDERRYGPPAPPAPRLATDPQVDLIVKLLVRRDSFGGFSGLVSGLTRDGVVDREAVEALTVEQASQVIDSLTERY